MKPIVYLAGPITGKSYEGATSWRGQATAALGPSILALSPMRGKDYLLGETSVADSYDATILSTQKAITTRDRFDTRRATVVLANLLGASRVSIGTVMELAWADAHRVPIVLMMENVGNPHDHAMIREVAGFRVDNLEDALATVQLIIGVS